MAYDFRVEHFRRRPHLQKDNDTDVFADHVGGHADAGGAVGEQRVPEVISHRDVRGGGGDRWLGETEGVVDDRTFHFGSPFEKGRPETGPAQ